MNLQIVSHVPTHFICFPGNIAIGPFENTLRGRDSPSLDRRVLHKAEVGMTDHLKINELLFSSPVYFSPTLTFLYSKLLFLTTPVQVQIRSEWKRLNAALAIDMHKEVPRQRSVELR